MLSTSHASQEEVKMMINLLRPEFVIPVIGEYQHQIRVKNLASQIGYEDDKILILDNGDVATFKPKANYVSKKDIRTEDILIDGTPLDDNNDVILRDRELLAEDGVVMVIANVNPKTREILNDDIEIITKGFSYYHESINILDQIREIFLEVSKKELIAKYVDWNSYKRNFRNETSKYIYQKTKRNPIIIPVIISTEI